MIVIHSSDFTLTRELRRYVRNQVGFALPRSIGRPQHVDVTLSGVNRPGGGIDKRCLIKLRHDDLAPILVEVVRSNLHDAVDTAVGRVARTIKSQYALDGNARPEHGASRTRGAHKTLKWVLSTAAAGGASSLVYVLETA